MPDDISLSGEALEAVLLDAARWRNFRAFAARLGGKWYFTADGQSYAFPMRDDLLDAGADAVIDFFNNHQEDDPCDSQPQS